MTIIPKTHPDDPADAITSLWLSILYVLAVTVIGGTIFRMYLLGLIEPDIYDPTPITDIISYDIAGILDESINVFVIFSFLMLCFILFPQLPGWWAIWKTSRTLQSLPGKTKHLSLLILQGIAWIVAVAYLWFPIGVGGAVCGFEVYLAMLNPQFTWIKPENTGVGDLLWNMGQALWLLAAVTCIQLPVWWGLWSLNRPASPIPNDPQWQRWHERAVRYLKASTVITVIAAALIFSYRGLKRYQEFIASGGELDISFGLFVLFVRTIIAMIYVLPILFLVQLPGWLVMARLEKWRRQAAGIPKPHIKPLRLLQGIAIGYLAMVITARITWWVRLEYVDNHDFEDAFTPHLTPVLDALLWAQIPGWIALCLWLAWWLNQARKQFVS